MKESTTPFDEKADGYIVSPPGKYPAHLIALEIREWNSSKIFNATFKVADEVSKLEVPKMISDGDGSFKDSGEKINGKFLSGKKFYGQGVWFTPEPANDEKWKKRKYKDFCESLGVKFDRDKDNEDVVLLKEIEESDVIGSPCLVKVEENSYENKSGEIVKNMKVNNVYVWKDGISLNPDELTSDVPF